MNNNCPAFNNKEHQLCTLNYEWNDMLGHVHFEMPESNILANINKNKIIDQCIKGDSNKGVFRKPIKINEVN